NAAGHLLAGTLPLNRFITWSAIFLATAQLLFFANLIHSLLRGSPAPRNPWQATTLEWHPALHPNAPAPASEEHIVVYRQPCEYQTTIAGELILPQWHSDAIPNIKPQYAAPSTCDERVSCPPPSRHPLPNQSQGDTLTITTTVQA